MAARPGYRKGFRVPAIRALLAERPRTLREIAEAQGISLHTARGHLDRMRRDGAAFVRDHAPGTGSAALWAARRS